MMKEAKPFVIDKTLIYKAFLNEPWGQTGTLVHSFGSMYLSPDPRHHQSPLHV